MVEGEKLRIVQQPGIVAKRRCFAVSQCRNGIKCWKNDGFLCLKKIIRKGLHREIKFFLSWQCLFEVLKRGSFFKTGINPERSSGFFFGWDASVRWRKLPHARAQSARRVVFGARSCGRRNTQCGRTFISASIYSLMTSPFTLSNISSQVSIFPFW